MIGTYDIKDNVTKTDKILSMVNYINEAKTKGVSLNDSLAITLRHTGELCANKIKQGKMSDDEIETVESFITQFTGENANKYFNHIHEGLPGAAKDFLVGDDFAKQKREQRNLEAHPVMDAESYVKEFKKLGH